MLHPSLCRKSFITKHLYCLSSINQLKHMSLLIQYSDHAHMLTNLTKCSIASHLQFQNFTKLKSYPGVPSQSPFFRQIAQVSHNLESNRKTNFSIDFSLLILYVLSPYSSYTSLSILDLSSSALFKVSMQLRSTGF